MSSDPARIHATSMVIPIVLGASLALVVGRSFSVAPVPAAATASAPVADTRAPATVPAAVRTPQPPAAPARGDRTAVDTDLPARIHARLAQLGRAKRFEAVQGYFPATARGAQLAAAATLYDDIPDDSEAGIFARSDLLPDLIDDAEAAAAAVRHALTAMPPGDGDLLGEKQMLINFVSGHATLDVGTITDVLVDYLAVEQPGSIASYLAINRLFVACGHTASGCAETAHSAVARLSDRRELQASIQAIYDRIAR
jgi:hypothetical protein